MNYKRLYTQLVDAYVRQGTFIISEADYEGTQLCLMCPDEYHGVIIPAASNLFNAEYIIDKSGRRSSVLKNLLSRFRDAKRAVPAEKMIDTDKKGREIIYQRLGIDGEKESLYANTKYLKDFDTGSLYADVEKSIIFEVDVNGDPVGVLMGYKPKMKQGGAE